MWLDFVTYLHHHGHEEKLPWYRGKVLITHFYASMMFSLFVLAVNAYIIGMGKSCLLHFCLLSNRKRHKPNLL